MCSSFFHKFFLGINLIRYHIITTILIYILCIFDSSLIVEGENVTKLSTCKVEVLPDKIHQQLFRRHDLLFGATWCKLETVIPFLAVVAVGGNHIAEAQT